MHISIDWIKEFVNLPEILPNDLAFKFTLATAEVEGVVSKGDHLKKIKIVQIEAIKKHPEADKLNLVTFKVSPTETFEVVCGAANVKVGLKVPYAPLGTLLPNGLLLEPKKIRGVVSHGMLCSEEELGTKEHSDGLMELPESAPLGQTMLEYLNEVQDTILDVDNKSLTHRPDLWGHYGMAREFATIFKTPLKNPFTSDWEKKLISHFDSQKSPIVPKFEGESAGLCYYGLSLENVKVAPSPAWLKKRLESVGLRSINNIVDISNYVMLELGIPLHIFDRNKIEGHELIIKRVGSPLVFKTLDEVDRNLISSDTVISDSKKPLVLAGIMGGLNSGVDDNTKNIFIEVANWKAAEVRRTSTRLGLRTDSSMRYEKSLDSALCRRTLLRTLELVLKLSPEAKVVGKAELAGSDAPLKAVELVTTSSRISNRLGKEISTEQVESILSSLGFSITKNGQELKVSVPSYRATKDVECEADVVEEIGRIIGYDNISPTSPLVTVKPIRLTNAQKMSREIRDFLTNHTRSFEILTYPMIGEKLLKKVAWPNNGELKILNALSVDHDRMRPSLIPTHLEAILVNSKNFDEFRFFELGRSYHSHQSQFANERSQLGIVFYDKEKSVFLELLNNLERLFSTLNLNADFIEPNPKFKNSLMPDNWNGVHPFEYLHVRVMGKIVGQIFSIHPMLAHQLKLRGHTTMAQVDLTDFESAVRKDKTKYLPLPKFPESTFDWSVVVSKESSIGALLSQFKKVKSKELASVKVLDTFNLLNGDISVTLRATLIDLEATLSAEVVATTQKTLIEATTSAGFPLKV